MSRWVRLGGWRPGNSSLQALVGEMPLAALLPLGLAIALMFSVLGPTTDMLDGARQPADVVIRNSLLAAVIALGYAFGSMRRNLALFLVTVAVQIAWYVAARRVSGTHTPALPLEAVPARLKHDAAAVLLAMVGSYASFLWFMNGTAARYLRVRTEIDLAHGIHQVLVPVVDKTLEQFEFFGFSAPSGEVGGDLVDVVALPDRGWFGYVADVSGHGVSSGVVMGMFKSALRMRLLQHGPLSTILDELNTVLFPLKSSNMFVTVACVRGGAGTGLEFAVAGHLPILRLARGSEVVEEVTTPQIPIGMFADYKFVSSVIPCGSGDLLALITDGLTEVFDPADREFGMEGVKRLLQQSSSLPLPQLADRIVAAARAHGTQMDDQTLLLIRAL
jgi:serine phosphatase RsbU (regulator of sigma subunit)